MREIKFRAWDKKEKIMTNNVSVYTDQTKNGAEGWWSADIRYDFGLGDKAYCIDSDTGILMQYTGLKDKNGKEIYEGDIVKYGRLRETVVFENGCFELKNWRLLKEMDWKFWEVIGNIYENPEIMEE